MIRTILEDVVQREWLDYNEHMNVVYYHRLFDRAVDALWERVGLGADYARSGVGSVFALEDHFVYERELRLGDSVSVDVQLLGLDERRIHFFQWLRRADAQTAATCEHLSIYVDFTTRRAARLPPAVYERLNEIWRVHQKEDKPANAGRALAMRR